MKQLIFKKTDGIRAIAWLSSLISSLKDKEYVVQVKEYHKRRSLDANAYCWELIGKLSKATGLPKNEIYKSAIKEIGGVSETVCVQTGAAERLCKAWQSKGLGWQSETFDSKIDGCTNVILHYGSSAYDTAQMSRLIDNIVQDCRALNIETMTPRELEDLKAAWK